MTLTPVEQSIIYTLAYTAQFDFPLTKKEIADRLIFRLSEHQRLLTDPSIKDIQAELDHLEKRGKILLVDGYYFLPGFADSIATRNKREDYAEVKAVEIKEFLESATRCSWIKAIFVTGSAAMKNAEPDADIDFMIVTQPHRLWLARLWVIWQAWRRGKRRSWQGEEKRSWCFNVWLESDRLTVFDEYQSLYTAYELIQAVPVFDHENIGTRLMTENAWAATYVPQSPAWKREQWFGVSGNLEKHVWSGWTIANYIAYALQRGYMNRHMTRERVELGVALFHPRDTQAWIMERWRSVLRQSTRALVKST